MFDGGGPFSDGSALGEDHRGESENRDVGVGEQFVDHAMAGDGGESRSSLGSENHQVGLLGARLVEQLFSRIAGDHDGLDLDFSFEFFGDQLEQVGFEIGDGAAGQDVVGFLRLDDVLQNQPRAMLGGQFGCEGRDDVAGIEQAERAKDGVGGVMAVAAVHHLGTDNIDGNAGAAQYGLGHRANQQFADRSGRMSTHDHAVNFSFLDIGEDLVGGQAGPYDDFTAEPGGTGELGQGFKMLHFGARGGGVVVVADTRRLRSRNHKRVIG